MFLFSSGQSKTNPPLKIFLWFLFINNFIVIKKVYQDKEYKIKNNIGL